MMIVIGESVMWKWLEIYGWINITSMSAGTEGMAVDSICISAYPVEQFIPQRNNTVHNSGKSIAEVDHTLYFANQCTQRGSSVDLGAGANAGSRTDITFITNNPLSELVWSPQKGLSLKCADFSLAQKSSLLWSTESGNMIISPPQSLKAKENGTEGTVAEGNSTSTQLLSNLEEMCNKGTSVPSPRTTASAVALCQTSHAQSSGSDNGRSDDSLQHMSHEPSPDVVATELKHGDINKKAGSNHFEENREIGIMNILRGDPTDILGSDVPTEKKHDFLKGLNPDSDGKHVELVLASEENKNNGMKTLELIKLSSTDKPESTAENDAAAEDGSAVAKVGMDSFTCQLKEKGKNSLEQNQVLSQMYKVACIKVPPNDNEIHPNQSKGKEKALSDMEVDQAVSREEDDSHESVESSNSGRLFCTGKRAWCFEEKLLIRSKKMKKGYPETPCLESFFRKDSSFMNYVSNMIKGSSKFDLDETPSVALTKPTHHPDDSLVISHGKQEGPSFKPMGFQSIFQALYRPSLRIQEEKSGSFDHQIGNECSKELEVANKIPSDAGSTHMSLDGKKNIKSLELIPISSQSFCQAGECTLIQPDIPSANINAAEEKPKSNFGENHNSCIVAHAIESGGAHISNSSFHNNSLSPPECKRPSRDNSIDPNRTLNLATNSSSPFENLWITRFSPKASGPVLNSVQGNPEKGAAIEGFTDCNMFLPYSQTVSLTVKRPNNGEDSLKPSTNDEMIAGSRIIQNYTVGPAVSCGSKRANLHTDQKRKSKLSPILPSEKCKKSEPMASVFARRLDALKHIIPSKAKDSTVHPALICFFCGIRGHTLRDCAEIVEAEFDDLLKNLTLFDGAEEASSFCIRCFRLNHWAIACPYASCRKDTDPDGNGHLDGKNQALSAYKISHWKKSKAEDELGICKGVHNKLSRTMILNGMTSDLKPGQEDIIGNDSHNEVARKHTPREFMLNPKHASSSSEERVSKEKQIMPFFKQIPDVPRETFELIRKLRLSRSDIIKWMKSPAQNFCLEGFFVRLRLGKWEEGLGGTGYHVACINGTSQEKLCRTCKTPVSVDIGGMKCLVDCRYISNHDFVEDELMAWWCTTVRGGSKIPSEEYLNVKLLEKNKYGF